MSKSIAFDVSTFDDAESRQWLPSIALLIGAICCGYWVLLRTQAGVAPWEPIVFAMTGFLLIVAGAARRAERLAPVWTARLIVVSTVGLLLMRLTMILLGDAAHDGGHSLFMPVFSYYLALYLLFILLLPYPASAQFSVSAWLAMASLTTLATSRYWTSPAPPEMLGALMIYVWAGHGSFLVLLYSWARRRARMAAEQAESARVLRASELRFRMVFEQSAAGIGLIGADQIWIDANQRMAELTGYRVEELRGLSLKALLPDDEQEAARGKFAAFLTATTGSDQYASERQCVRKDGSRIWLANQLRRIPADADHPVTVLLMSIDISERKQAEFDAAEERRLREFQFEQSPYALIEWTPELRVRRWSPQAELLFGWSAAEVRDRNPWEWGLFFEDDYAVTRKIAERLVSGVDTRSAMIQRIRRKDGRAGWYQWHHVSLRDVDGNLESILSTGSDVSELRFALQALEVNESQLRAIFEQAAVGVSLLNADGSWNKVNQRLCEITGYSEQELLASDYQTITLPEDLSLDADRARQLIEGEIGSYDIEKRYVHKQGHIIWVKVFASRIDATAAHPPLYVAVVEDISERRSAEASLQRLHAELERKVTERTRQLQDTMRDWVERNGELRLLAEMIGVMQAANDSAEANRIVAHFLPQLFKRTAGALWMQEGQGDRFTRLADWGEGREPPLLLASRDCWGLRLGRPLHVENPDDPLACEHLDGAAGQQTPHACVPVLASGDVVGLIHLHWSERVDATMPPPDRVLVAAAAEQIGLAIGNVRLREELRRQATRDALTGLCNRRTFEAVVAERVEQQAAGGAPFLLLLIDIDHFKSINDRYGHDAGDAALVATAQLLERSVPGEQRVFRLGGEEFVAILDDDLEAGTTARVEWIRAEVEAQRLRCRRTPLPTLTVSIGVARCPVDGRSGSTLLKAADTAMYAAKRLGRNRVVYAGSTAASGAPSATNAATRTDREQDLQKAC